MSFSLNEVQAMAKRASRGAGYSWGLSEEAGAAVRWLSYFGLNGPEQLATLLTAVDGQNMDSFRPISLTGDWASTSGKMCPITAGATLADCAQRIGDGVTVTLKGVLCPVLLSAFAAQVAQHTGQSIRLDWQDACLTSDGHALSVTGTDTALNSGLAVDVTCRKTSDIHDMLRPALRARVEQETLRDLNCFAHRTYAPATEDSRRRGAG